jgi:MFS family permease
MSETNPQRAALKREPNFKWLMRGGMISMLGDQLTMIALPWLVLKLTADSLALGLVIALMAIPRAVFILLGGAIVDRYSPQRVLMLSKYASALLLAALTLLIVANQPGAALTLGGTSVTLALSPHATLSVIYVLAFGLGLAQAFGIPSGTSMLPRAIAAANLQAANGILMGLRQLTMLLGPLLAAALLAMGGGSDGKDSSGLAFAFGFDCLSFLYSAWTLAQVRPIDLPPHPAEAQSVLRSIGAGLKMVWDDQSLRLCFIYWGAVTLLIGGSMQVALPLLASQRLHGAATLGLLMGAHGAGTLIGMVGAAKGGKVLRLLSFGTLILLVDVVAGLLLMPMGAVQATWQGMALLAVLGLLTGFVQIAVFTWLQRRVPPHMMGRAMSIFMFIFVGLAPLSAAGAGWLLTFVTLQQMFAGGGIVLVVMASAAWLFTPMRHISAAPGAGSTAAPAQ